jgi:hypothetical protein
MGIKALVKRGSNWASNSCPHFSKSISNASSSKPLLHYSVEIVWVSHSVVFIVATCPTMTHYVLSQPSWISTCLRSWLYYTLPCCSDHEFLNKCLLN